MSNPKHYRDLCLNNIDELTAMVLTENSRQLNLWGVQDRTAFEWMCYLTEEVGEMAEAVSENQYRQGNCHDVVKEAIQVATLALKLAEMYDTEAENIKFARQQRKGNQLKKLEGK